MKVLQKTWVRILLVVLLFVTLLGTFWLNTVVLWSTENPVSALETGSYQDTVTYKEDMIGYYAGDIEQLCAMENEWRTLRDEEVTVRDCVVGENGATLSPRGDETTFWKEYLDEQGVDEKAFAEIETADPGKLFLCEGGMKQDRSFVRIDGADFSRLLDACSYERMFDEKEAAERSAQITIEENPEEEDDGVFYDEEITYDYDEDYKAEAEERLSGYLNRCYDFTWEDSWYDTMESVRLYEADGDFLLYNEKTEEIAGSRIAPKKLTEISAQESLYFSGPDRADELDGTAMLVGGFTSSLEQQMRYEVFGSSIWLYGIDFDGDHNVAALSGVTVIKGGELFFSLGETGEKKDVVCIGLDGEEEMSYVFGRKSGLADGYEIRAYFYKDRSFASTNAIHEFLYSTAYKYGDISNWAVCVTVLAVLFGLLTLCSILPPLWQREEKKFRDEALFELNILFTIGALVGCVLLTDVVVIITRELLAALTSGTLLLIAASVLIELFAFLAVAALYQFVSTVFYRCRKHCFLKGWLAGRFILWLASKCKTVIRHMDILKRRIFYLVLLGGVCGVIVLFVCACASSYSGFASFFGIFSYIAVLIGFSYVFLKDAVDNKRILDGCNRMKDGRFGEKIATGDLYADKLELAEAINTMGEGLEKAVASSMRDERMKTELITNVSHDIKTPLTSIINYVDLLKRDDLTAEQQQEYLKVLDVKSQRLKQLIEDLIEVSKTSTGSMELQMDSLDFKELLSQAVGEFEEKFAERDLELVVTCAEHKIRIWADGRRCYRILENLFSNVFKYAMPNTRVYVDLDEDGRQMLLTIKNISEAPLNIAPEELLERFVRGDASRSTGGSGLGLSIAENLTKLQQGTMEIQLDGDLFKVQIRFPLLQQDPDPQTSEP